MSYYAIDYTNELAHHGILGMKWGVRRFQNEDGSLTSAGKIRYYGAGGDRRGYYRQKGQAKRYKDAVKYATKKAYKTASNPLVMLSKGYRTWRKEDANNRGIANYANYQKDKRISAAFGNNKKALADARYAYEHKNLSKYVNRDGSLTTAGKLKYWDTDAARGQARMQRDISRDKRLGTTTERANARYNKNTKALRRIGYGEAGLTAAEAARLKLGAIGSLSRGNVLGAAFKEARSNAQLARAAVQYGRTTRQLNKRPAKSTVGQQKVINYQANLETKGTNAGRKAGKAIGNAYTGINNRVESTKRTAANKVKNAALYSYNTNLQTMKKAANVVTPKKKKRS